MTLSKTLFAVIFLPVFSLCSTMAHATTVYKWVDEDGQVHYGSKPRHKDAEEVKIKKRYIDSVPQRLQQQHRNGLIIKKNLLMPSMPKTNQSRMRKEKNVNRKNAGSRAATLHVTS